MFCQFIILLTIFIYDLNTQQLWYVLWYDLNTQQLFMVCIKYKLSFKVILEENHECA